jgi:molecular chaperone GrpE
MNSKEQIPMPEETLEELDADETSSVDDFIKELEAKEKDLHITADLTIEIAECDFDSNNIPEFVKQELPSVKAQASNNSHAAPQDGFKTRVYELENEIEALSDRITNLRTERNEIQEKSDRRLKDFESYKYRMDRERRGSFIDQIANLAQQMLPVLDNLDRAIDSVPDNAEQQDPVFQQFFNGIVIVNQQVSEIFSEMGVQPIVTVGEIFDPSLHEAVATEERDDLPNNTISAEMLRGYRIGNKVIRHSMVKVTSKPPAAKTDKKAHKKAEQTTDDKTDVDADEKAVVVETPSAPVPEPSGILPVENDSLESDASPTEAE